LKAYPEGSLPVIGNPDASEYIAEGHLFGNEDSGMIRVDHDFSDAIRRRR
jgi:hypothetical protein